MAEFKRLSEVDLLDTTSDNATVLVEEDGEIKRVPKKEVGGAGGYIIKLANSYIDDNGMYCLEENYDELYDILMAGGSVWVDYTDAPGPSIPSNLVTQNSGQSTGLNAATNFGAWQFPVAMWIITDVGLGLADFRSFVDNGINIYYPNGSHNLDPIER